MADTAVIHHFFIDFQIIARLTLLYLSLATLALVTGIYLLLQYELSKKENKWLGLILPIASFCISLVAFLGLLVFTAYTGMVNGEVAEQTAAQAGDMSAVIATALSVFVLFNIPTVILLAIYGGCRSKRNSGMRWKMNV